MDVTELHKLIDEWAAKQGVAKVTFEGPQTVTVDVPEKPKDKRVVRTKSTGDRVYYIDEVAKTKQWVAGTQTKPGPELLKELGFEMSDVEEVDDSSLLGYTMGASIYKVD